MTNIQVVRHGNQKVLTSKQLADAYGTDTLTINNNFSRNKTKYTEGKHYYKLSGKEKNTFIDLYHFDIGLKKARELYLWTEKGAALHAKSLGTDQAWEFYEKLVDEYFKMKETLEQLIQQNIHTASDMLRLKDKVNEKRVPKDYVSVLQILARILYKVESDLNQALDPNACTEISAGKAFAQYCRTVLGIPDHLVITYPHLLNNGKVVQAKAYPGRYEHDLRIYIENEYLPNKFPEYAAYRKQSIQKQLSVPKRKLIP